MKPDVWVLAVRDVLLALQEVRKTHPDALPANAEAVTIGSLKVKRDGR